MESMKYLPFEKLTFETDLSEDEVKARLLHNVEEKKYFRFGKKGNKPYEGYLNGNRFEINRIITYRNSFLPLIKGQIIENNIGTQIQVKMSLYLFVFIFMIFWCGVVGLAFIALFIAAIINNNFQAFILIPLGMFIFGYLLTMIAFKAESSKSKKDLKKILKATIVE